MIESNPVSLNIYQKRQAALLYYFSSMEFLDEIISHMRALTAFSDRTLEYSVRVERDEAMRKLGWDEAHLSSNWSTHAHPMLQDCLRGLLRQKQMRVTEWYDISGVSGTLTGMDYYSMSWTLPAEEEKFRELSDAVQALSVELDSTVNHDWTDLNFTSSWKQYEHLFPRLPKFRIRTDVEGESGKRPVRTGVYLPQDDSCGTLQFAWTGNANGSLGQCETLSDLALEYLTVVGRDKLWLKPDGVARKTNRADITDAYFDDWCRNRKKMQFRDSISARNARAFESRQCKWYFVEMIDGEWDDNVPTPALPPHTIRCQPGEIVPRSGWWHSPALRGEEGFRYFDKGSNFPSTTSTEWGMVFWNYEPDRQK